MGGMDQRREEATETSKGMGTKRERVEVLRGKDERDIRSRHPEWRDTKKGPSKNWKTPPPHTCTHTCCIPCLAAPGIFCTRLFRDESSLGDSTPRFIQD